MSTDRETIFKAIRSALAPLPTRTEKPDWDEALIVCKPAKDYENLRAQFADKVSFASARYIDSPEGLSALLLEENSTFGYCDPKLAPHFEKVAGIRFDTEYDASKINDYSFCITRATKGIAESGTIMLKDDDTSARLAALTPWIHIAVLEENDIVESISEAIQDFGDDPSVVFATGPSKTADVEGILIQGVHGPGIQVAYIL